MWILRERGLTQRMRIVAAEQGASVAADPGERDARSCR